LGLRSNRTCYGLVHGGLRGRIVECLGLGGLLGGGAALLGAVASHR
jgi:hypothetical protein